MKHSLIINSQNYFSLKILNINCSFGFLFYLRWFSPMITFFTSHLSTLSFPKTTTKEMSDNCCLEEASGVYGGNEGSDRRKHNTKMGKTF